MTPSKISLDTARDLMAGFGVEDIAVRHGYALADVRAVVADKRKRGSLHYIAAHARNGARQSATLRARRRSDRGR